MSFLEKVHRTFGALGGFASGALGGAALGGPHGVLIGGCVGAVIGYKICRPLTPEEKARLNKQRNTGLTPAMMGFIYQQKLWRQQQQQQWQNSPGNLFSRQYHQLHHHHPHR